MNSKKTILSVILKVSMLLPFVPQGLLALDSISEEARSMMWYEGMQKGVPSSACSNPNYLECYKVTEEVCLTAAQTAAVYCTPIIAAKYPLISSHDIASKAGAIYATCVFQKQALISNHDVQDISVCLGKAFAK